MEVSTRVVFDTEPHRQADWKFLAVESESDEPVVLCVNLADAFDGNRWPDEIAAKVLAEWIDAFIGY